MKGRGKSTAKARGRVFFALMLAFAVADLFIAPMTDARARQGDGYAHSAHGLDPDTPGYVSLRGGRRVLFNFRNFFHWWLARPRQAGPGLRRLLAGDGNSAAHNFIGHFCVSLALALLGLALFPRPLPVAVCGTFLNIFHEYIAEGRYVDPSFVDLWLDQFGLALAVIAFILVRRLMRSGKAKAPQRET